MPDDNLIIGGKPYRERGPEDIEKRKIQCTYSMDEDGGIFLELSQELELDNPFQSKFITLDYLLNERALVPVGEDEKGRGAWRNVAERFSAILKGLFTRYEKAGKSFMRLNAPLNETTYGLLCGIMPYGDFIPGFIDSIDKLGSYEWKDSNPIASLNKLFAYDGSIRPALPTYGDFLRRLEDLEPPPAPHLGL